jgi:hypothetical protein
MLKSKIIPRTISETFPRRVSDVLAGSRINNRRAVPMTSAIAAGVDLTKFETDYYYSANFDMLFVERGSRLDVWLYLAVVA